MLEVLRDRLGHVRCAVEHLHHRHNASAILRTCDALGIHRVHLVGDRHFAPSQGASRGAYRWLELYRHRHASEAIAAIRAAGCRLYVADLADDAVAPRAVPLDQPVCLWFGAELAGVCDEARDEADGVVTIPMRGMAQSLNVSVATALALEPVAERARQEVPACGLPDDVVDATLHAWLAREVEDAATAAALADALRA